VISRSASDSFVRQDETLIRNAALPCHIEAPNHVSHAAGVHQAGFPGVGGKACCSSHGYTSYRALVHALGRRIAMSQSRVLITGASGRLGQMVLDQFLHAGVPDIVATTRTPEKLGAYSTLHPGRHVNCLWHEARRARRRSLVIPVGSPVISRRRKGIQLCPLVGYLANGIVCRAANSCLACLRYIASGSACAHRVKKC